MRLLIVARPDGALLERRPQDVLLPTTAAAMYALIDQGALFERVSDRIKRDDYHSIWNTCAATAWRVVDRVRQVEDPSVPNLANMAAYSMFLALTQGETLVRALDRLHQERAISAIAVEQTANAKDAETVHWESRAVYLDIAQAWAVAHAIPCDMIIDPLGRKAAKAGADGSDAVRRLRWPTFATLRQRFCLSLAVGRQAITVASWLISRSGASNAHAALFYFQHLGLSGSSIPANACSANWLSRLIRRLMQGRNAEGRVRARSIELLVVGCAELIEGHGWLGRLVAMRAETCAAKCLDQTACFFHIWRTLVRRIRRLGRLPVLLNAMPFAQICPEAMVGEAFRTGGGIVAEVCHGANYSFVERGGCPTGLPVGPAQFAFHWGTVGSGEVGDRLFNNQSIRQVKTGSMRSHTLLNAQLRAPRIRISGALPTVLYAPTVLTPSTILGNNVPWDKYLSTLDYALTVLANGPFRTIVSYLPGEDMNYMIGRRRSSPIEFYPHSFSRFLPQADYIVVDSLGGSPIYEALTTDKPILCYTALEVQQWNAQFLAMLRQRVICCDDVESYRLHLSQMAADPISFFASKPRTLTDEMLQTIAPPVSEDGFWQIVTNAIETAA